MPLLFNANTISALFQFNRFYLNFAKYFKENPQKDNLLLIVCGVFGNELSVSLSLPLSIIIHNALCRDSVTMRTTFVTELLAVAIISSYFKECVPKCLYKIHVNAKHS